MIMSKSKLLFLFLMVAVMFIHQACTKVCTIVLSTNNVSVLAAGGVQYVGYSLQNVNANSNTTVDVEIDGDLDWISNLVVTNESIVFTVNENVAFTDRQTSVTVSYPGAENRVIKVYQEEYVISVGDYFCKTTDSSGESEWYLVSKEKSSGEIPYNDVIGIVFSTDTSRIGELEKQTLSDAGVTEPRGLVIAVKNAASGVAWGTAQLINSSSLDRVMYNYQAYADVNGLKNTQTIWNYESYSSTDFPAFDAVQQCNSGSNSNVPSAPDNTTGWFMPSTGNLWDLIENVGGYSLERYYNSTSANYVNVNSASAISNINASLQNLASADPIASSDELRLYCTSSEENNSTVNSLYLGGSANQIYFIGVDKQISGGYLVRPVLAF